ncbi:MAG: histidinol-phosphate transaminase [Candidatus Lokiarchaeota archaeon]|nr:histidinol-phosphate transaminase [Candidatus Lokiarchaeota archaeon]MBD3202324.1 histidinol-phosphate transaminase [Candidatus Lokiarchaeota archaeon]
MELNKLIRSSLRKYNAYEPGEQPTEEEWIKLNTNENPYPPIEEVTQAMKSALNERLKLYPDPNAKELRKLIVSMLLRDKDTLTTANSVFIGNGSDDVLDVIMKVFIEPGDNVLYFYPSYGMYKTLGDLYNASSKVIKLNEDFSIPDSVFESEGKLLFINSPNNPTGASFGNATLLKICTKFPGIVVVDEAYADFSKISALSLLKKVDNLIVIRSFSKSFSLASMRIGFAIAHPDIIKIMNSVKLPYNTNYLAQIAAKASIKNMDKIFARNEKIISERTRVMAELGKYEKIKVYPSDANFVFIEFTEQATALKFVWDLKDKKILVRHFNRKGLYEFIRVSIGTEEQNNKLLCEFRNIAVKNL